jgi:hypothetical protein
LFDSETRRASMGIQDVRVTEPAILIRIPQLWDPAMSDDELYDATRGYWRVGPRRERAELALSIAEGVVREVFTVESWHRAGTTESRTTIHSSAPADRWEFVGVIADDTKRYRYLGRSVRGYFVRGNQNPIRYVNC